MLLDSGANRPGRIVFGVSCPDTGSMCPTIGPVQPRWQAGVFPDPDGATAIMKRFAGSSYVPNTFTVVFPISALVEVSALIIKRFRVLPRDVAYTVNHSLVISGTTASNGKITSPSFSSRSFKERSSLSLCIIKRKLSNERGDERIKLQNARKSGYKPLPRGSLDIENGGVRARTMGPPQNHRNQRTTRTREPGNYKNQWTTRTKECGNQRTTGTTISNYSKRLMTSGVAIAITLEISHKFWSRQ